MSQAHALTIKDFTAGYGAGPIVSSIAMDLPAGSITALVGANGAGKTTLLLALSGLCPQASGSVMLAGRQLQQLQPQDRVAAGLVHCPEGRRVFARMSVEDNLRLGAYLRADTASVTGDLEAQYSRFPRLKDRRHQWAGTLSGGEQQMLALARAAMASPKVLLLDEPSLGLAPQITEAVFAAIVEMACCGITVLVVEQNAHLALSVAQQAYVLEMGKIVLCGAAKELAQDERIRQAYLGGVETQPG